MKKQTGFGKGLVTGLVLSALVATLGISAMAAVSNRTIQVEDGISLSLNGASFIPRDVNGNRVSVFRYNGTVYAPVRAVCEAAGMDVEYNSATRTVQLTTADQLTAGNYITEAQAKSIALKDAGVQESAAVFLTVRLDWDDGRPEYEVEFYSGRVEYDYEIHAVTGAILSSDRDLENFEIPAAGTSTGTSTSTPSGTTTAGTSASTSGVIGAEKAKSIALDRAPAGTTVYQCKLDRDDGRTVYEVEMRNGRMEYDCEIDAYTGAILKWESDYD